MSVNGKSREAFPESRELPKNDEFRAYIFGFVKTMFA
jgi:hypothetical protein